MKKAEDRTVRSYPQKRDLDGVYFRVKRDDKWDTICWSDLTEDEMDEILAKKDAPWLRAMCKILGNTIYMIGDSLNIRGGVE